MGPAGVTANSDITVTPKQAGTGASKCQFRPGSMPRPARGAWNCCCLSMTTSVAQANPSFRSRRDHQAADAISQIGQLGLAMPCCRDESRVDFESWVSSLGRRMLAARPISLRSAEGAPKSGVGRRSTLEFPDSYGHGVLSHMSRKHAHLIRSIFHDPPSGNIHWREVESLLHHLGAAVESL
jgi:hypothetical protein